MGETHETMSRFPWQTRKLRGDELMTPQSVILLFQRFASLKRVAEVDKRV
jgi:hypothetical protein